MPLRHIVRLCLCLLLANAVSVSAQYRRPSQPPRTSPRAVAVLEIMPTGSPHLYPVSLMLDGKFYDASLYAAKPVPLALYGDTVYEAQKSGMPVGLFTVQRAGRIENTWWGEGRWKPLAADEPAAKTNPITGKEEGKSADKKSETKKTAEPDDPDRPVLKKPQASAPPPAPPKPSAPSAEAVEAEQRRAAKAADDDPNRPALRRGKPTDAEKEEPLPTSPIAGGGLPGKTPAKAMQKPTATYVAVSDAEPYDNRPYDYMSDDAQRAGLTKQATEVAVAELRKFAAPSGRKLPPAVTLTDVEMNAFDLDYSNSPYIILSGKYAYRVPPAKGESGIAARDADFYVTVVTRMNIDGKLDKVLAVATDSLHLDAYPQLQLIDAIDVDADGRGELLFRQIFDHGRSYIVYRVLPYQVSKVFEGGSGQ